MHILQAHEFWRTSLYTQWVLLIIRNSFLAGVKSADKYEKAQLFLFARQTGALALFLLLGCGEQ
jgi:hypothetical protein